MITALVSTFFLGIILGAQSDRPQISKAAADYLDHALDLMQQHALHRREIDFQGLRKAAAGYAPGAQTAEDTYPAIVYACSQLKDHSSHLEESLSTSSAIQQRSKAIEAAARALEHGRGLTALARSPFADRRYFLLAMLDHGPRRFAYIVIPFSASAHAEFREAEVRHQWAEELYGLIDQASREGARGWILDLRGNGGGYLGPMLAGAQPLLGEGKLLELRGPDAKNTYSIKHGAVLNHFGFAQTSVEESLPLSTPVPRLHRQPVAILIDHATASGAESLAIAFRGRPHTIFIGEPTSGLTSSGTYWDPRDGAVQSIISQQVYDRRDRPYPEGIQPELKVADPASVPEISADPAIVAAQAWLANQP